MLNYKVPKELLESYLPQGLELDSFKGGYYLTIVGYFSFNTRLLGMPFSFHPYFENIDLRFYVKRKVGRKFRRGMVYIKKGLPRRSMAMLESAFINETNLVLPMGHKVDFNKGEIALGGRVEYNWHTGPQKNHLVVLTDGSPRKPAETSLEHFINERLYAVTKQSDDSSLEYEIRRPSWRVTRVVQSSLYCDAAAIFGPEFASVFNAEPDSAFLSEGSKVEVMRPIQLLVPPTSSAARKSARKTKVSPKKPTQKRTSS